MSVIRMTCIDNFLATAKSSEYQTTPYDLGGVGPGERVYGGFHLTGNYDSTTRVLVATLEVSSCSGFIGASVDALTFTLSTALGSTWGSTSTGGIASTDRKWWRGGYTMSTAGAADTTGGTWTGLMEMGIR